MKFGELRELLEGLSDSIDGEDAVVCCQGESSEVVYEIRGLTVNHTEDGTEGASLYYE